MKKIVFYSCMAAALLSFAGCEETGNDFEGTNYIYLEAKDGKSTMFETDSEPLVVDVVLTKALEEDLQITFELAGPEGVVELSGNPVTIKAGEKTASFSVVSLNANALESSASYRIGISSLLPEGVQLKEPLQFVVNPVINEGPVDQQAEIIEAYKTATGIDLSKYIGEVSVTAVISGYDVETYEDFEKTVTGKTLISLSEESTADAPILKMTANPMGVQDFMYSVMKAVTVDDVEGYWFPEDYPMECYAIFTEAINWNSESQETFNMTLDGITFAADRTISFVAEYINSYDEETIIVPFEYAFSAYDREQTADFSEASVKPGDDEWLPDCTANPAAHLNLSGILYDEYESEGEGYYVEPVAEIAEDGSLVFTFCFDHKNAADYTRVVATYTPNN